MEQLLSISTLSIAELRKILSDNETVDTSQSKADLLQQVTETLLTKIYLDEQTKIETETKDITRAMKLSEQEDHRNTIVTQDEEYNKALQEDISRGNHDKESSEELSPEEMRQKRIERFG